ncbi:MAG: NFACT family protein, partial [Candidatus Marsarchaeota archaeon]|nr:NFACT family protein [Candidatus Marsarchaeota archaeon]
MREPSTLDLAAITLELGFLKGFYIEKFYELPNLQFRLKLNKSGEGQYNLMIVPGRLLSIASVIVQQDQPTNFSQAVRKRIANSHISDISLFNDDRVLCITVEKGDQHQYIMVEMFGRGNLIITDSDLNIELAYMRHEFSDRKIFNGEKYVAPRNKRITISRLSEEKDVEEAIQAVKNLKGKSVMQALSSVI